MKEFEDGLAYTVGRENLSLIVKGSEENKG